MRTLLHLVANDGRFLRYELFVWAAILLLPVVSVAALNVEPGRSLAYHKFLQIGALPILLAMLMMKCGLTIRILQKENLCNRKAYWLTRPFPWHLLMFAKWASLLVYVLLPLLVAYSLSGAFYPDLDEPLYDMLRSVALFDGTLITYCAALGIFTRTSGQAFLGFFTVPIFAIVLEFLLAKFGLRELVIPKIIELSSVYPVGEVMVLPAVIIGIVGCALRYKNPARWGLALACFLSSGVLMVLTTHVVPVNPVEAGTMELPAPARLRVEDFYYERIDYYWMGEHTHSGTSNSVWDSGKADSMLGLEAVLQWEGLPDEWFVDFEVLRTYTSSRVLLGVKKRKTLRRNAYQLSPEYKAALFENYDEPNRFTRSKERHHLLLAPKSLRDEMEGTLGSLVKSTIYRPLPRKVDLSVGSAFSVGDRHLIIEAIEWKSAQSMKLTFRYLSPRGKNFKKPVFFVLRSKEAAQIIFGDEGGESSVGGPGFPRVGQREYTFKDRNDSEINLEDLELYVIEHERIGFDVREVSYRMDAR